MNQYDHIKKGESSGNMPIFFFLLFIIAFVVGISMYEPETKTVQKEIPLNVKSDDLCEVVGGLASAFMMSRQMGLTIEQARNTYIKANPPKDILDIVEHILKKAYEQPISDDKIKAITDFSNTYIRSCLHVQYDTEKIDII